MMTTNRIIQATIPASADRIQAIREGEAALESPGLPDLAVPAGMGDDEVERVMVAVEGIIAAYPAFVFRAVAELVESYGHEGLAMLGSCVHQHLSAVNNPDFAPSLLDARRRAAVALAENDVPRAVAAMQRYEADAANYRGTVVARCGICHRYREGTTWRELGSAPAGYRVLRGWCPDCDPEDDRWADDNDDLRGAAGRDAVFQWLAEVDGVDEAADADELAETSEAHR